MVPVVPLLILLLRFGILYLLLLLVYIYLSFDFYFLLRRCDRCMAMAIGNDNNDDKENLIIFLLVYRKIEKGVENALKKHY
jgi:hypothetical protein